VLTAGTSTDLGAALPDVADNTAAAAFGLSPGPLATDTVGPAASTPQPKAEERPLSSLWAVMLAKVYEAVTGEGEFADRRGLPPSPPPRRW
jgi:hypothetical protein